MFDHEKKYDQDEITYVRSRTKVLNPETSLHKIHRMELATPRDVSDQHRTVLAAVRFIEAGKRLKSIQLHILATDNHGMESMPGNLKRLMQ
jgi:hypothetical protein